MKNIDIAKKELKLHKFKSLINKVTATCFLFSPSLIIASLNISTLHSSPADFLGLGALTLWINFLLGISVYAFNRGSPASKHFVEKLLVKGSISDFEKNNEENILKLRTHLDLSSLTKEEKDKMYKLCAEILVDEKLYSQTYALWMEKLSPLSIEDKDIQNQFKRLNLLSLVEHIKVLPGFSLDLLKQEMDLLENKEIGQNREVDLYSYFETKITRSTPSPTDQKTELTIKDGKYALTQIDYDSIAKIIKQYKESSFAQIEPLLGHLNYPQVSWAKIKSVVEKNHSDFSNEYLKLIGFLNTKLTFEVALLERLGLSQPSIKSVAKDIANSSADSDETLFPVNNSILLSKYEALNFTPNYNQDLWKNIKLEYDTVFQNKEKLDVDEFKKLNIMLHSTIPILKSSDYSLGSMNVSLDNPTQMVLIQNLEMVKNEILRVKSLIESKMHTEILVENTYLKMKASR